MKLKSSAGVTFRVDDVEKSGELLELGKTRDSIDRILRHVLDRVEEPVLACSGYNSDVVAGTVSHAFINAIHTAYARHLPLILSPDMVWITILQGLALHVHLHAEELRPILVQHSGRKEIQISMELDAHSPESAWDDAINAFASALCGESHGSAALLSDFSTTGPIEKLVSQVCLLDVFESYYEYILLSGCGFPEITLTGTADDWSNLRRKIDLLERFQIDFWLPHLRRVADIFCDAAQGRVDVETWKGMYKLPDAYGGDLINGWIVKLIPYVQNKLSGNWDLINPVLTDDGSVEHRGEIGVRSDTLPAGMSLVPFRCVDRRKGDCALMEMIGGFVGIEQDQTTGAVKPKIGWAVRHKRDQTWSSLASTRVKRKKLPLPSAVISALSEKLQRQVRAGINISGEFFELYKQCNGFSVTDRAGVTWKLHPFSKVRIISLQQEEAEPATGEDSYWDPIGSWAYYLEIGAATDGSRILLSENYVRTMRTRLVFPVEIRGTDGEPVASFFGLRNFISYLTGMDP